MKSPDDLPWDRIKLFAMDVDGILTDGSLYVSSSGEEMKRFSIVDGLGLAMLREAGVILAWISGRASEATTHRAVELKIAHLVQGQRDKISALKSLMDELQLVSDEVVYMGDDIIDAPAIAHAGIGVTVPEGQAAAREAADYITERPGGHGAVREICNLILLARS